MDVSRNSTIVNRSKDLHQDLAIDESERSIGISTSSSIRLFHYGSAVIISMLNDSSPLITVFIFRDDSHSHL